MTLFFSPFIYLLSAPTTIRVTTHQGSHTWTIYPTYLPFCECCLPEGVITPILDLTLSTSAWEYQNLSSIVINVQHPRATS